MSGPDCALAWCEDHSDPERHSTRVWHWDGDGLRITFSAGTYVSDSGALTSEPVPLLVVENMECDETVSQNIRVEDLDEIIAMLTRARVDVARSIGWAREARSLNIA